MAAIEICSERCWASSPGPWLWSPFCNSGFVFKDVDAATGVPFVAGALGAQYTLWDCVQASEQLQDVLAVVSGVS